MVLYEKNGNFVGIGKEELSFLGFEDFEEFKSEHKDFADLFINKPGFIFKFKNFSWIDYTLHSGAPKKSVIIKLKNGQEVETGIRISEIFLTNPLNQQSFYYGVELTQNNFRQQATPVLPPQEMKLEESTFVIPEPKAEVKVEKPIIESFEQDYISEPANDTVQEEFNIPSSYEDDYTPEVSLKSSFNEEPSDFKLKTMDDYEPLPEQPKLKVNLDLDDEPAISFTPKVDELSIDDEEPQIKIASFSEPEVKSQILSPEVASLEKIDFDLAHCAEETGLDLGEIAQLVEEYHNDIDIALPKIKKALESSDDTELKNIIIPLKGISDNLQIIDLSMAFDKLFSSSKEEQEMAYERIEEFTNDLKNELI